MLLLQMYYNGFFVPVFRYHFYQRSHCQAKLRASVEPYRTLTASVEELKKESLEDSLEAHNKEQKMLISVWCCICTTGEVLVCS